LDNSVSGGKDIYPFPYIMPSMTGIVSKLRLLLSSSYARDGVKASHACQNHGKLLPNYCQFMTSKRSQPRPFPAPI
jgi:hypothetical protein